MYNTHLLYNNNNNNNTPHTHTHTASTYLVYPNCMRKLSSLQLQVTYITGLTNVFAFVIAALLLLVQFLLKFPVVPAFRDA